MAEFNLSLDRLGLEKFWYSLLATHIAQSGRADLQYLLHEPEFVAAERQGFDFLSGLSIGEISVLYEYALAYVNRESRKQEGQYFTPDDVALVMARQAATFPKGKVWVDPCSGVGNLSYWLVSLQDDPEEFLSSSLYLIDRDPLALFIARSLLTIHFQKKDGDLFMHMKGRFIVADFLSDTVLPTYDYAILNPPYVVVPPDEHFETSASRDLYAYFLERVAKTAAGFVSITPQTFTNGHKFYQLRRLLLERFSDMKVYCFDNVPDNIFRGMKFGSKNTNKANSTRAGIIVARGDSEKRAFQITPLLRWKTEERAQLLQSIDDFLVEIPPRVDVFPKLQRELLPLYESLEKDHQMLAHLVSRERTPYQLVVPSTPRYYISALKTPVDRSSFRTLYFYTEQERDMAYLLLNSSYMYWWWRVHDGGMTISEKTLLTVPVSPNTPLSEELLQKIERSEVTNRVVKRNAGKDNENVKHDASLIHEINNLLFPRFAGALEMLHHNSVLA